MVADVWPLAQVLYLINTFLKTHSENIIITEFCDRNVLKNDPSGKKDFV